MLRADAELIVASAYLDLIGWPAPPPVLDRLASELSVNADASALVRELTSLPEYASAAVERAYDLVWGRSPRADELTRWRDAIDTGSVGADDVPLELIKEAADDPRRTPESFLALVYAVAHERVLNVRDADTWSERAASAGRRATAELIWGAEEASKLRVTKVFRTLLWRDVDAIGMQNMLRLSQRDGLDALRAAVIGSAEYLQVIRAREETV